MRQQHCQEYVESAACNTDLESLSSLSKKESYSVRDCVKQVKAIEFTCNKSSQKCGTPKVVLLICSIYYTVIGMYGLFNPVHVGQYQWKYFFGDVSVVCNISWYKVENMKKFRSYWQNLNKK